MKISLLIVVFFVLYIFIMILYIVKDFSNYIAKSLRKKKVKDIIYDLGKEYSYWDYYYLLNLAYESYFKIKLIGSLNEVEDIKKNLTNNYYETLSILYYGYEKHYSKKVVCDLNITKVNPIGVISTQNNEVWFEVSGTYLEYINSPLGVAPNLCSSYEYNYISIKHPKDETKIEQIVINYLNKHLYSIAQNNYIYKILFKKNYRNNGRKRFVEYIRLVRRNHEWLVDGILSEDKIKYKAFPIKIFCNSK